MRAAGKKGSNTLTYDPNGNMKTAIVQERDRSPAQSAIVCAALVCSLFLQHGCFLLRPLGDQYIPAQQAVRLRVLTVKDHLPVEHATVTAKFIGNGHSQLEQSDKTAIDYIAKLGENTGTTDPQGFVALQLKANAPANAGPTLPDLITGKPYAFRIDAGDQVEYLALTIHAEAEIAGSSFVLQIDSISTPQRRQERRGE